MDLHFFDYYIHLFPLGVALVLLAAAATVFIAVAGVRRFLARR